MSGIYIHIPFCKQACHYCDFHFRTNLKLKEQMVQAIVQELKLQKNYLPEKTVRTIYFGGGTPSILQSREIGNILEAVYKDYEVAAAPEITLEANPDDLSKTKLNELSTMGINRLSIGIQSFEERFLKLLNRAHGPREALQAVENARSAGFDNLNLDLIYAIPHKDHSLWQKDLDLMMKLRPEHLSAYSLTIEENTALGRWTKKGRFSPADDHFSAEQFEQLMETLSEHGYQQYEISNFCLPEKHSRHNTAYWKDKPYLGIGPGAHSYNGKSRQYNILNNPKYIRTLENGNIPFELETLDEEERLNEYLLTSLRTMWGINLNYLQSEFQDDLLKRKNSYLSKISTEGFIEINNQAITLTKNGRLLADKIACDLFL